MGDLGQVVLGSGRFYVRHCLVVNLVDTGTSVLPRCPRFQFCPMREMAFTRPGQVAKLQSKERNGRPMDADFQLFWASLSWIVREILNRWTHTSAIQAYQIFEEAP